ncbi:unnamed protein product [Rhodiola kirilowii]
MYNHNSDESDHPGLTRPPVLTGHTTTYTNDLSRSREDLRPKRHQKPPSPISTSGQTRPTL